MLSSSRVVVLVLCVLLALMCPADVSADPPVVVNGGFETDTGQQSGDFTGWTKLEGSGCVLGTDYAHSGSQSMRFTCTECAIEQLYAQAVDVSDSEGQLVRVSGWLLWGSSSGSSALGGFRVLLTDSDDCSTALGTPTVIATGEDLATPWVWIAKSKDIAVPESPSSTYLCVYLYGEDNILYFDDIAVTQLSTSVSISSVTAHSGRWTWVALLVGVVGVSLCRVWRRRIQKR